MAEKDEQSPAQKHAAERRADAVRALEEELRGYVTRGMDDRVKQVEDAIRRAKGEAKGRSTKKAVEG